LYNKSTPLLMIGVACALTLLWVLLQSLESQAFLVIEYENTPDNDQESVYQVFWDTGDGYSERLSRRFAVEPNVPNLVFFEVPPSSKSVRVDLPTGHSSIKHLHVVSTLSFYDYKKTFADLTKYQLVTVSLGPDFIKVYSDGSDPQINIPLNSNFDGLNFTSLFLITFLCGTLIFALIRSQNPRVDMFLVALSASLGFFFCWVSFPGLLSYPVCQPNGIHLS